MSNHPRADAPGNVPLFRCNKRMDTDTDDRPHEYNLACKYFDCQPCGFRTPTTAEDDLIKVICEETKLARREKP